MNEPLVTGEIGKLSVAERILIVEEIWDSIAAEQELLQVSQAQKDELDRRIDAYHASPDEGSSWKNVKGRLIATIGRNSQIRNTYRLFLDSWVD